MKIGLLGGTFDPVHNGHLGMARAARDHFALDEVLFLPAGQPWRKTRQISAAEHRLVMLRLAIKDETTFGICDLELRTPGPSYTADTLDALTGERLDDMFWFIIGADALADIPNWKDPLRIIRHAILAVTPRLGFDMQRALAAVPELAPRIAQFPMSPWNESSSEIRRKANSGDRIDDLVPTSVAAYIEEHRLYM